MPVTPPEYDPYVDAPELTDEDFNRMTWPDEDPIDEFAGFLAGEYAIGDDDILGIFGL